MHILMQVPSNIGYYCNSLLLDDVSSSVTCLSFSSIRNFDVFDQSIGTVACFAINLYMSIWARCMLSFILVMFYASVFLLKKDL